MKGRICLQTYQSAGWLCWTIYISEGKHIPKCLLDPGLDCTQVAGTNCIVTASEWEERGPSSHFWSATYSEVPISGSNSCIFHCALTRGVYRTFSQNLTILEVGRDLWRQTQGHLELFAPDHVQTGFGCPTSSALGLSCQRGKCCCWITILGGSLTIISGYILLTCYWVNMVIFIGWRSLQGKWNFSIIGSFFRFSWLLISYL